MLLLEAVLDFIRVMRLNRDIRVTYATIRSEITVIRFMRLNNEIRVT
jgi:hypothetical protein